MLKKEAKRVFKQKKPQTEKPQEGKTIRRQLMKEWKAPGGLLDGPFA